MFAAVEKNWFEDKIADADKIVTRLVSLKEFQSLEQIVKNEAQKGFTA